MKLYIFDDALADGWDPFALTRPCSELLFGTHLLRQRLERFAGTPASGLLTRPWLESYREEETPPVIAGSATIDNQEDRLFLCSRYVPPTNATFDPPHEAACLRVGERVVGSWLPAGSPTPDAEWFRDPVCLRATEPLELSGTLMQAAWELVAKNPERLRQDLAVEVDTSTAFGPDAAAASGVGFLGSGPVRLGEGVFLEPNVVLDTRTGPVWLDAGVEVRAGSRLAGPLYVGPGSRILGGSLSALSAGPCSYLRGEIEASVIWGYSNKAHTGFLGHAYVGRWVNLGALTTNSDLKNNYGTVRVGPVGEETDTGIRKLGCLLGDHVKTGIGTLLNTGTVVGAGSNLFGDMPPKWVPPFSWGSGANLEDYRKEAFLRTAETVLSRRGVQLDDTTRAWLGAAWDTGHTAARP